MNERTFPPGPPPIPPRYRPHPIGPGLFMGLAGPFIIFLLLFALPIWIWFFWRIEVGPDRIAILIHKTGKNLPPGQILALKPDEKGIQLNVLAEGRYFRNPYSWGWIIGKITDIPPGKLGVKIRQYGDDLPSGQILATATSKGILPEVMRPGKERINPYAYQVEMFDAVNIKPGAVGVVTSLVGRDVLTDNLPATNRNTFLVSPDMKGVQAQVLDPGTYYLNPYMVNVVEVTLQSQRFAMSGDDAINFLTSDGFTITVEGTLEYALMRDKVALLTHQIGDMDDILKKIILPRARGFSRIEGSKNPAKNYITGDTRQKFQDSLQVHLQGLCKSWGIDIRSVLIRNITPPDQIASIIRDREVAVQTAKKFEQQIEQAKSQAELTRQEMLAAQNKVKVESDTVRIRALIRAKQEMAVRLTGASRELEVAKLENDASVAQAESILLKAGADKEVVRLHNEADAAVFGSQVQAYGSGMNYARRALYEKLGPRISTIVSSDQKGGLGSIFAPYLPAEKEAGQ